MSTPSPATGSEQLARLLESNAAVVSTALRGTRSASPLSAVIAARTLAELAEDATRLLVDASRTAGHTWHEIGAVLGSTRQGAHQRFGAATSQPDEQGTRLAHRAIEMIQQIRDGKWRAARSDWTEQMRAELPRARLESVWTGLRETAGTVQAIGRPVVLRKGPFRIADVPLAFEHGPMTARVSFDHDERVAGLFFLLPEAQARP